MKKIQIGGKKFETGKKNSRHGKKIWVGEKKFESGEKKFESGVGEINQVGERNPRVRERKSSWWEKNWVREKNRVRGKKSSWGKKSSQGQKIESGKKNLKKLFWNVISSDLKKALRTDQWTNQPMDGQTWLHVEMQGLIQQGQETKVVCAQ